MKIWKNLNYSGYVFRDELSSEKEYVFERTENLWYNYLRNKDEYKSLTDKKDTGSLQIKLVSFLFFADLKNIEK